MMGFSFLKINSLNFIIMRSYLFRLGLVLSFIFFSICVSAQNFTNGYVITLKGDTIIGLIDYKNWRKNPTKIKFKSTTSTDLTTYKPTDILSFSVIKKDEVETYTSAHISIDNSSNILDQMDTSREFSNVEIDAFLLEIFNGTYTLYEYEDQKEHYLIRNGNNFDELKFKNYITSNKIANSNNYFRIQLSDLLKSCTGISQEEINRLSYKKTDLIEILTKYDKCLGKTSYLSQKSEKVKLTFGAVVGIDYSKLLITNAISSNSKDLDLSSGTNFAAGLSLSLNLARSNRKHAVVFELLYRKYSFKGSYDDIKSNEEYFLNKYKFDGNYAKINSMYRYQFTPSKISPFINAGISNAFKLSKIDKSTTDKKFYSTTTSYANPIFKEEAGYEFGLNLGFGILYNKISLELRGEYTNGFSPYPYTKTSLKSAYLNLGYSF